MMELSPDDVAGIVDMFGALTRDELAEGLDELAYRRGESVPEGVVEEALASYVVVDYEEDGERLLAPGPSAFPTLPEGAADLPHILDVDDRNPDREALAATVEERFREDVVLAGRIADAERIERLLDVSYDLDAWGPVEVGSLRDVLDDAFVQSN